MRMTSVNRNTQDSPREVLSRAVGTAILTAATAIPASTMAAEIEEVIVTAQKRQESSQDIGAAITALGSDQLINSEVNNIQDIQNMAPSLQIGETFGFAAVMIRGIGTDNPFAGGDPSVAMHFDGVVTGQSSAQFGSLFDIERVEVLRGPQGTLYGRNATGGSINVITHKPSEELEGYTRLSVGNYELTKFEGAVGGPLSDSLQGRIAVRSVDRGGYGENIATGKDIDDANQQSVRAQLLWQLNNNMDLRLAVEYHEEDDTNYMPKFRAPTYDPAPLTALEPQPTSGVRAADRRDINSNVDLQNERDQSSFTLEYNWDINENLSLTSLTNYQTFDKVPQADFDMTEVDFYVWSERFDTEQTSEELRLNFEGEKAHGLVGLYYYAEEIESVNQLDLALDPGPPRCTVADNVSSSILNGALDDICFNFSGSSETEAYALFANVAYALSDTLTLNLGGRYSYEKKEGFTDRWIAPGMVAPLSFSDEKSFNEFSPSVRLEWDAAEDVIVYASFSEGFKSGIFLTGQRTPVLEPEIVDAYELGMKGMFLDRQLQFNAAAFMYDYTDLQQGRSVPAGSSGFTLVYENAASAEIKGVEAEFTWLPTDHLRIDGSATYLDATFDDYVTTGPLDTVFQQLGLIDPSADLSQQLSGNRMVQSPEWAWSLGATFDFQLPGSDWQGAATVSAAYKDRVYFSQFNHEALSQESVTTVNANINLMSADERWSVNLWGKNLTDETIYMGTFILNSSRTNAGFLAPPRSYGLTVGYNF